MNLWLIMVLSAIISGVVSTVVTWLFYYHKQSKERETYLKKKIAEIERETMK